MDLHPIDVFTTYCESAESRSDKTAFGLGQFVHGSLRIAQRLVVLDVCFRFLNVFQAEMA